MVKTRKVWRDEVAFKWRYLLSFGKSKTGEADQAWAKLLDDSSVPKQKQELFLSEAFLLKDGYWRDPCKGFKWVSPGRMENVRAMMMSAMKNQGRAEVIRVLVEEVYNSDLQSWDWTPSASSPSASSPPASSRPASSPPALKEGKRDAGKRDAGNPPVAKRQRSLGYYFHASGGPPSGGA